MRNLLKLEEILQFLLGIYLFTLLAYPWWLFLVLIMLPDIGILGYLFGNKVGALCYNIFHHKGLALALYFTGTFLSLPLCQLLGAIIFAHAGLDRIFGYGLKYQNGFKYTHLGEIGGKNG